jgi:hypothetical protein
LGAPAVHRRLDLAERTSPDSKSGSAFVSVIVEGMNVDFSLPLQYLTLLLKIVTKSQQYLKQPSDKADWLCCSFINVQDHIQIPIARAALRYILECAKDKKFVKHCVSVQDKNFRGFLRPILRKDRTAEIEGLAYELLALLVGERRDGVTRNQSEGQL